MTELSVKAANGTLSDIDRANIQDEINEIRAEMSRIFDTTYYNERKIWEQDEISAPMVRAVPFALLTNLSKNGYKITENVKGIIPITDRSYGYSSQYSYGQINITADATKGVAFYWTGENGKDYATDYIGWKKFKKQNYSVQLSDLYDKNTYPDLYDGDVALIDAKIDFSVADTAEKEDVAKALNGQRILVNRSVNVQNHVAVGSTPDKETTLTDGSVSLSFNTYMIYDAAYAFKRNFDMEDNDSIIPSNAAGNLTTFPTASDPDKIWKFTLKAPSTTSDKADGTKTPIEFTVTANQMYYGSIYTPSQYSHSVNDESKHVTNDHFGEWWEYWNVNGPNGNVIEHKVGGITHYVTPNITGLIDGLLGTDANPGVLAQDKGGDNPSGGTVNPSFTVSFDISSTTPYVYGDKGSTPKKDTHVGNMYMTVTLNKDITKDEVVASVTNLLNKNTVFDLYSNPDDDSFYLNTPGTGTNQVIKEMSVKKAAEWKCLSIQAGTESYYDNLIEMKYRCLNNRILGIDVTDVSTQDGARDAIDEIGEALKIVSEQRSLFGAYQNRLEHAYNVDSNIHENTQAAESLIRDTEMAGEMTTFAKLSILAKAGESMMAQANQTYAGVVQLLQ